MHTHQDGSLSGRVLSVGEGIERETIYLAFDKYRKESAKWFTPRSDSYSTISTSQSLSLHFSPSSTRLESLSILGALTGLMLVYGVAPTPLSPALVQFLLHGCDLQSLTPSFIQEWFPNLHQTLTDWNTISSGDSIDVFDAHFQLYHDFPVFFKIHFTLRSLLFNSYLDRFLAFKTEQGKHTGLWQLKCCIERPLVLLLLQTLKWLRSYEVLN